MELHNLKRCEDIKHRRKRVGRGDSSGLGHTCGRGMNGQMSRSGAAHRPYFEGGQIPFFRRLPKRGFKSLNHKYFNLVNIDILNETFEDGSEVTINDLRAHGIVGKSKLPLKVLGNGEISKKITIIADKFSAIAKSKIEAAGGNCKIVANLSNKE